MGIDDGGKVLPAQRFLLDKGSRDGVQGVSIVSQEHSRAIASLLDQR
jgi:hypothetical protein